MKKYILLLAVLVAAFSIDAHAQGNIGVASSEITSTVANLPPAASCKSDSSACVRIVTDGSSSTDCTVGGGTTRAHCSSNGSVWAALGGSGGSSPSLTGAVTSSGGAATLPGKDDVLDAVNFCTAAGGSSTTYTCSLSPAITGYVTGTHYRFKADVANTAASTINFNSIGAVTIKKAAGGVTTDIVANDLRAGQWVDLVYDGTNMQMQSTLGNASAGSGVAVQVNGSTSGITTTANFQNTDTAYNQLTADSFSATGTGVLSRPYIAPPNCFIVGDSISTIGITNGATAAPTGSSGWANLLFNNECSGNSVDQAASGDMAADQNIKLYSKGASPYFFPVAWGNNRPFTSLIFIGANEVQAKQVSNYLTGVYRPSIYSMVAWLSIPRSFKLYGQDAGCTKTGTWTADDTVLTGMGEKSNTNADTISCAGVVTTAASPWIYYGYKATDGNAGASSIKVDGAACTDTISGSATINYVAPVAISTTNGQTSSVFVARCAASAGTHTVLVTVTSATNASNVVRFQWVGSMPTIASSPAILPRILHLGVLRQLADATATWTNSYNLEVMNMVATLSSDTMPVQHVPNHDYTVATLPTPTAGALADVNDGASATDCTTGSGSTMVRCRYSGSAWVASGVAPVALSTTAANYNVDSVHLSNLGHQLFHDRVAALMGASGGNVFTSIALQSQASTTTQVALPTTCISMNGNNDLVSFGRCSGGVGDFTAGLNGRTINADGAFQIWDTGLVHTTGQWGSKQLDNTSDTFIGWSNSTTTWTGVDTTLSRNAAGVVQVGTTAANSSGTIKAAKVTTDTNCAAVGTSASPSVAACGSATAGHFSCATNASTATCTVNTTAVTASSEIFVFESDTTVTGTALGVTCNTGTTVNPATRLLASSVAATSFTINLGTVTTNPACFSYFIIN